jgi:hypothetical protein
MIKNNPLGRRPVDPLKRFVKHVAVQLHGCIFWLGSRTKFGYGKFRVGGRGSKTVVAHKFAYESIYGPLTPGVVLDHLCRQPSCVNVLHLEAVTQRVNLMRSDLTDAWKKSHQTHCKRGHEFTESNTRIAKNGSRHCKECERLNLYPSKEYRRLHMRS